MYVCGSLVLDGGVWTTDWNDDGPRRFHLGLQRSSPDVRPHVVRLDSSIRLFAKAGVAIFNPVGNARLLLV